MTDLTKRPVVSSRPAAGAWMGSQHKGDQNRAGKGRGNPLAPVVQKSQLVPPVNRNRSEKAVSGSFHLLCCLLGHLRKTETSSPHYATGSIMSREQEWCREENYVMYYVKKIPTDEFPAAPLSIWICTSGNLKTGKGKILSHFYS